MIGIEVEEEKGKENCIAQFSNGNSYLLKIYNLSLCIHLKVPGVFGSTRNGLINLKLRSRNLNVEPS